MTLFDVPAPQRVPVGEHPRSRRDTIPFLSARVEDPPTSVEAAKSLSGKTDKDALELLRRTGIAMTTDQVAAALHAPHRPTVASAMARLHKNGWVVADGNGKSALGRKATKWRAA